MAPNFFVLGAMRQFSDGAIGMNGEVSQLVMSGAFVSCFQYVYVRYKFRISFGTYNQLLACRPDLHTLGDVFFLYYCLLNCGVSSSQRFSSLALDVVDSLESQVVVLKRFRCDSQPLRPHAGIAGNKNTNLFMKVAFSSLQRFVCGSLVDWISS